MVECGFSHRLMSPKKTKMLSEANDLMDSSGSSSQWTDDLPIPASYTYHIIDIHNQQPTRWVYDVLPELIKHC
jgi:hypothetical protein